MVTVDRKPASSPNSKRFFVAGAIMLAAGSAEAADLPTTKSEPPAPPPAVAPALPFYVKFGFTYAINASSSKLYAEPFPGAPQLLIPGVGANVGDVATLGAEAGYFINPNVSFDLSLGIPVWAKVKTKGGGIPIAPGLAAPAGTTLSEIMPSFIPLTLLYHFNQMGPVQPYLGGGLAAVFSFADRDRFDTGVSVDPTVGLVLQGGADVMIDSHWGLSFDVKKLFADAQSHSTGINLGALGVPGGGIVPVTGTLKTYFQPWVLSTGIVYRF